MTGITESSTTITTSSSIVKKAVGGFVAQKYLTVATGIFGDKKPQQQNPSRRRRGKRDAPPPVTTRLLRREKVDVKKKVANTKKSMKKSAPPSPKSHLKTAAIATFSALGMIYVLYPTSLLLAMRIPETMSWVRLFQNYHACARHGIPLSCAKVGAVQLFQLLSSVGSVAYFWALMKGRIPRIQSVWKGILYYGLFWMLAVAIMKVSVDELALYKPTASEISTLQGKIAVITGANRGIGLATAQWMALQGAHVVMTCRSIAKCQPVVDEINHQVAETCPHANCGSAKAAVLDLSSLQSANNLVESITNDYPDGIHYLFCNAGTTPQYPLTREGFEDGFGGMHLAHMAVALGLLPSLKQGAENNNANNHDNYSRIVMVSSEMSINAAMGVFGSLDEMFDADNLRGEVMRGDGTFATSMPAYGRAKLCNVLLAMELNRQLKVLEWPVVANAVHTGAVVTDSSRNSIQKTFEGIFPGLSWLVGNVYFPLLWRNVDGGRRTLLCAALSERDFVVKGGQYLDALCRPFLPDSTTERDFSPEKLISIPLGGGKSLSFNLDATQALLLADSRYSKFLWNTSIELLVQSPARSAVYFEGKRDNGHDKQGENQQQRAAA